MCGCINLLPRCFIITCVFCFFYEMVDFPNHLQLSQTLWVLFSPCMICWAHSYLQSVQYIHVTPLGTIQVVQSRTRTFIAVCQRHGSFSSGWSYLSSWHTLPSGIYDSMFYIFQTFMIDVYSEMYTSIHPRHMDSEITEKLESFYKEVQWNAIDCHYICDN